jgi:hypothetical protein
LSSKGTHGRVSSNGIKGGSVGDTLGVEVGESDGAEVRALDGEEDGASDGGSCVEMTVGAKVRLIAGTSEPGVEFANVTETVSEEFAVED